MCGTKLEHQDNGYNCNLGYTVADKKSSHNVNVVDKKNGGFKPSFTSVDVVSAKLLVAVVSTGFFCNRMFEILAESFMMGVSQLHCNEYSSKKFVLVTLLACSYFYSSPAGLLG